MMNGQRTMMTGRKLLVINPNTNPHVTEQIGRAALSFARPGVLVDVVSPSNGPYSIETPDDRAAAIPEVISIVRGAPTYDGYVLACFDDIAIAQARRLVASPVISMAEAGIREAATIHLRFAVITTVEAAVPTIQSLADSYGMAGRHFVVATGIGVAETAKRTRKAEKALLSAILRCKNEFDVGAVLLGSGAYAGRNEELERLFKLPFIDGLRAAVDHCQNGDVSLSQKKPLPA